MKLLLFLVTLTGFALANSASAFPGNAPKSDTSEQLLMLFGNNRAFTATAEIAVKSRAGREKHITEMEYAVLDGKMRTEIDMTKTKSGAKQDEDMAMLAQMGLSKMVTIVRPDKKAAYIVYPGLKGYSEAPPTMDAKATETAPPKMERIILSKGTIDGHACVKSKITITEADGKKFETLAWQATDLNDFPIRTELESEGDTVVTTFRNIKLDKPAADLFEIPAGYKRYNSVQEMMMQSMQRMMGQ